MTGNTNKARAVFLAMLMIFSVFAGTVAFSGSAAADSKLDAEYAGGAVHYNNSTSSTANFVIEIPFNDGAELTEDSLDSSNFTLLDDGDDITSELDFSKSSVNTTADAGGQNDTVYLNTTGEINSNDLEIELSEEISDETNGETFDVAFAAASFTVNELNEDRNIYQGTTVAIYDTSTSPPTDFEIEGDDTDYFQSFSSGSNSEVFFLDTSNLDLDTYDFNGNSNFTVRDLGLDVEIDDLNVSADEQIEVTASATASQRPVTIELIDEAGDGDTVQTENVNLGGQGEVTVNFGPGVDEGDYVVQVTDDDSAVEVESSTITVEEDDDDAQFVESSVNGARGDIVEMTVEIEDTDFATITAGEVDGSEGFVANATVEDEDDDGQVTVYFNTFDLVENETDTGDANPGQPFAVDDDSDDSIDSQDLTDNVSDLVDAGQYDLEVSAGDTPSADTSDGADGVATLTLDPRSTETLRMWTGSKDEIGTVGDLEDVNEALNNGEITQSSEVAVGDYAVHQLVSTGLEGALDAREKEDVTDAFLTQAQGNITELSIEESDPGANQDARELNLAQNNVTVIADGPNDTYFVFLDTDQGLDFNNGDSLPQQDDTGLEANFTVISNDASAVGDFTPDELDDDEGEETFVEFNANEVDAEVDEPFDVSQAEGQTISGTTNIAPGTELTVRVRSDDVNPSFLKTASSVVQSDGTYSATFDFSEQSVGDEYDIQVNGFIYDDGPTEEDGTVVEAVATDTDTDTATPEPDTATPEPDTATPEPDTATPEPDTATPEPDTATPEPETEEPTSTPTSTPGFGVVVALTALLAAALLAVRRD
jgi:PGF-CTERM protein/surface glycoprotein (TIGR04207 family)